MLFSKIFCQVLKQTLSEDNCMDYVDRACMFRAKDLIESCLKLALEDPYLFSDADWTRLLDKHPELAVELGKCMGAL